MRNLFVLAAVMVATAGLSAISGCGNDPDQQRELFDLARERLPAVILPPHG